MSDNLPFVFIRNHSSCAVKLWPSRKDENWEEFVLLVGPLNTTSGAVAADEFAAKNLFLVCVEEWFLCVLLLLLPLLLAHAVLLLL
jgi:hypothetical protein